MSEDVWAARDTTPDAIEAALRELLRKRHAANRALAPARVLNLVVVVDREWKGEIANRLERVGRYHASRTILCAVEEGRETLDARRGDELRRVARRRDSSAMHETRRDRPRSRAPARGWTRSSTRCWCPSCRRAVGRRTATTRRSSALLPMIDVILLDSDDARADRRRLTRAAELLRSRVRRRPGVAAHDPLARAAGGQLRPALATARRCARLDEVCVRHQPQLGCERGAPDRLARVAA